MPKKIKILMSLAGTFILTGCGSHQDTTEIRVVGSSTVYPFATKVAEEFKNKTGHNFVIESTGSGGGHKLFCAGVGPNTPDITNSSRRQKASEFKLCQENGVTDIIEMKIGFDGIVLANALSAMPMNINMRDIYLAFAKDVPVEESGNCTLQSNPYTRWSEINPDLPDIEIEVYGPPPTSGTRDAFVEIAMENGAKAVPCLAALRKVDKNAFKNIAHILREDGHWIDAGENDNAIVQTLVNTPTAIGVFGYSFLDQNRDKIQGAHIDGIPPSFENITGGAYGVSRSLYFYIKKAHILEKPAIQNYAYEFFSKDAVGTYGYLAEIGLVPLSEAGLEDMRETAATLQVYSQ